VNLVTGPGHRTMQSATRRILRASFTELRTVKSPAAMNEVLVAGETVATASRLRRWEKSFAEAADRAHWRKMTVRRIRSASET
jgi:hypothetical protein